MRELMDELRRGGAADPDLRLEQLRKATDNYARAVRELRPTWRVLGVNRQPHGYLLTPSLNCFDTEKQ
jgi:hypothetical protein